MNCWAPMPFSEHARLEIVNEQEEPVHAFYFYIDTQAHNQPCLRARCASTPSGGARCLRMGGRARGASGTRQEWHERMAGPEGKNLSDAGNYCFPEAEGRGHSLA